MNKVKSGLLFSIALFLLPAWIYSADIFDSVKNGDIDSLKAYIADGGDVNAKNDVGESLLFTASYYDKIDVVKILLDKKADVNAPSGINGQTPLFQAVKNGNIGMIKMFINAKASVNVMDVNGTTALMQLFVIGSTGKPELLNPDLIALLKNAGKMQEKNIYDAALNGDSDAVKNYLKSGKDVNAADDFGRTLLMYSSLTGNKASVVMLLNAKADVNVKDKEGMPALMYMCILGGRDIAKLLIDAGADINTTGTDGMTVLMAASFMGYAEIVRLLLDAKADFNIKDRFNRTALQIAEENKHPDVVELLKKAGAKE